ncbi:MAG: hypothetical protein ABFS03_13060, partial [Chloroflexota bacterium]
MSDSQTRPPRFEDPTESSAPILEEESTASKNLPPKDVTVRIPTIKPIVTYTILGLTTLIYLLQMGSESLLGADLPAYYGLKVNQLIAAGQLWRLITPVL